MAILTKTECLKRIRKIRKVVDGLGYDTYEIYYGTDGHGKKLRESRSDLGEAKQRITEFYKNQEANVVALTVLTAAQVYDAKEALSILFSAGMNTTLVEAARQVANDHFKSFSVNRRCMGDVYWVYLDGIPVNQELHAAAVKQRVGRFVATSDSERSASEVDSKEIASYLSRFRDSPKTFNNHLGYIKTFFQWCMKAERRYCLTNPCADITPMQQAYCEPQYVTAKHFEQLMRYLEHDRTLYDVVPYAVLSFLCGMRVEEIERLRSNRKDILLSEHSVRVSMPKGWTKGMAPRMFTLTSTAEKWLAAYLPKDGIPYANKVRCVRVLSSAAKKCGFVLPRNAGRHSFITMHVAAFGNPVLTDTMTGTSSKMRSAHYQGLATKAEGEAYFNVLPAAS